MKDMPGMKEIEDLKDIEKEKKQVGARRTATLVRGSPARFRNDKQDTKKMTRRDHGLL